MTVLTELVAKISTDAAGLKSGLSDAEKHTEASSKKMQDSLKKVGTVMAASGAVITAALGLMGKAAIDEDINMKRLAVTINNSGTAYDSVKDSMEALIATTQRKTGIADNEQRDILNRLILVTNDYGKAMELLPTVLDLAAAGEMDATQAATYLGKAYLELEEGVEEVSVRFGQASLQFKNMEDIQNRVAGSAENLKNPLTGIKNAAEDISETIGAFLIPIIKIAGEWIEDIAIKIQAWAKEHPDLARSLTLTALALGGVLTVVGTLGLAIPPLIAGVKALVTIFGALKLVTLEYTLIVLAAAVAIYGVINLVRSFKGEAYVGTGIGDTIFGQIKQDIASLMGSVKELLPTMEGLNDEIDTTTEAGSNLSKALKEVDNKTKDLTDRFADLMRELQFAETEAGQLRLTMSDVYTAMFKLGYKTEEINEVFRKYGDITEIDEALLDDLGLTAEEVAKLVGKLKEETDKGTEAFKKYGEEAQTSAEKMASALGMNLAGIKASKSLPSGEGRLSLTEFIGSPAGSAAISGMMAEGMSKMEAISSMQEQVYGFGLPGYAQGGIVPGTIGQPQLAMVHGGETIIPANESMGGVTVNFTQPVFFDREDTMNRFVDMISKGIDRKYRLGGRSLA